MRFVAPARERVDPRCFAHPVFADATALAVGRDCLLGPAWPDVASLPAIGARRFVVQDAALCAEDVHYEVRIAERGEIPTRERNWHDLLNALIWLRWPALKQAMNARQVADIAVVGPKQRTRAQYALTQFDEAGVVLIIDEAAAVEVALIEAWNRHDWPGFFAALPPGGWSLSVIGHALLEHALDPQRLLVGKALLAVGESPIERRDALMSGVAAKIADATLLNDPLELRPLPLMGLPGWHPRAGEAEFLREAPCFQPVRAGRRYPPAIRLVEAMPADCTALG